MKFVSGFIVHITYFKIEQKKRKLSKTYKENELSEKKRKLFFYNTFYCWIKITTQLS